ncbi:hypothetical protein [Pseudoduganella sp. RAF53_2]|uniref:hypothetical protein n=1 Tax=unclassified Pseudoduganella TaxID=2637179 RepID=UPI003F9E8319
MNCNCVKEVGTKLASAPFITKQAGQDIRAECQATGLAVTRDMNMVAVINIPFRIRGTAKGFSSAKGKEMPCVATYCPFCGRPAGYGKYAVGQDEGIAAVMKPLEGEA